VSDFIDECRREWRRLRVPDPVANEMAADLAADLEEAEAEDVSPEEVLGSGASDPRSFAASWAAARGVGRPSPPSERVASRAFILAAIAALVVIAVSGAVLMILASPPVSQRVLAVPPPPLPTASGQVWVAKADGPTITVDADGSGLDSRAVGSVLLIVGLAGIVPVALLWLWLGHGRWSRRRPHTSGPPAGHAY
jgi:hypothetical protein